MSQTESDNNAEYVLIAEAAQLLGEKEARIFYYADRGDIGIEPGREGQRVRRYKVADILAVKQRRAERRKKAIARKKKPDPVIIDWIHAADLPAGIKLAQQLYNTEEVDLAEQAIYQGWRKNNPYLSLAAFSQDRSECYASIQLVPLDEQIALDVLSNRRSENSILPDEIRSYNEPGPYVMLGTSAICLPSRPELLLKLLRSYMKYWEEQYPDRYMAKIYAQAMSDSGYRLAQHLFMSPRMDLAYNAYELDLARPAAARIIREFKQRLEQIAPLPPALHWPPIAPTSPAPATVAPRQEEKAKQQPQVDVVSSAVRSLANTGTAQTLPLGYRGFTEFFKSHGIAETTAGRAADAGVFEIKTDGWRQNGRSVKKALDPAGQDAFIRHFRQRPSYHMCQVAECPCIEYGHGGYLGDESQ